MTMWHRSPLIVSFLYAKILRDANVSGTTVDTSDSSMTNMERMVSPAMYPNKNPLAVEWPAGSGDVKRAMCCSLNENWYTADPNINPGGLNQLGAAFSRFVGLDLEKIVNKGAGPFIRDEGCAREWFYPRDARGKGNEPNISDSTPYLSLSQIYKKVGSNWFGQDPNKAGRFVLTEHGIIAPTCDYQAPTASTKSNSLGGDATLAPSSQPVSDTTPTPAPSSQPVSDTTPTPAPSSQPASDTTPAPSSQPASDTTPTPTPAPSSQPASDTTPVDSSQPASDKTPVDSSPPASDTTPADSSTPNQNPIYVVQPDTEFLFEDRSVSSCVPEIRLSNDIPIYMLASLFMREHNRLADAIAKADTKLSSNQIFTRAMNINIRQYQQIVKEWVVDMVGEVLGNEFLNDQPADGETAKIYQEFATAVKSSLVSLASNDTLDWDNEGKQSLGKLNSQIEGINKLHTKKVETVLRGLLFMPAAKYDLTFAKDLKAMSNGQKRYVVEMLCYQSRDHGIPDMATLREKITGTAATTYEEINPDTDMIAILKKMYPHLLTEANPVGKDVDAPFGLLTESTIPDGAVGITAAKIIMKQFKLADSGPNGLKKYCEAPTGDAVLECNSLKNTTIAHIILRNTGLQCTNRKGFFVSARSKFVGGDLCRDSLTNMYDKFGALHPLLTCKAPGCKDYVGTVDVLNYKTATESPTWYFYHSSLSPTTKLTLILVFTIIPITLLIGALAYWQLRIRSSRS